MKKMHHMSLMTELLIGTIGSILIVATFLSISFFSVFMYNIRKSTISSVTQTMETLDMHILGILGEYNDKVKTISNVVPVLESREQIRDVLVNLGKGLPSEALLYYATAEQIWDGGTLISHSGWEAPSDFDMQSRLWHKNALSNTNKICYTTPFVDVNTGKLIVTVSYRVFDNGGRIMGVAAFDIVLDALSEAVRNISLSPNSRINIVTKDGLYITNERSSAIMNENYFDTTNFKTYTKSDYLNGMSKSFTERGTFYGVHPIENTDWYIVAEGPISDFASEFERIMMQVLLTLVVLVAVMVGGAVFLSKKVSNCFNFIAAGCEVIAKGDFTKKYPDYYTTEASLMARGFNSLSERLQGIVESMKQSKTSLSQAGEELKGGTADTEKAIQQIIGNTKSLDSNLILQNTSIEQTSQSVDKILNNITSLEKLVSTQAESVQGASSAVEQMIGNISEVNRSVDKMAVSFGNLERNAQDGAKTQNELQQQISEIENQSNLLSEANTVIASIAEQTNLLAMNAAIEAAHAGEAGKGFAVVADEIRKLSETSSTQSKTIGEQLTRIQETIGTVVSSTQKGVQGYANLADKIQETDTLVQQIKAAMGEQQEGSAQITGALHEMNDSTQQVQLFSKEMADGSRTIMENMQSLQKKTASMHQNMKELNVSSETISKTGTALSEISVLMEESITEIGKQIDQFEV